MAGLIGRNGAGKTTLMRSIMGCCRCAPGSIVLDDVDLGGVLRTGAAVTASASCRRIGALIPDLSVAENVLLPAWAAKLADADERLAWTYARVPGGTAVRRAEGLASEAAASRSWSRWRAA